MFFMSNKRWFARKNHYIRGEGVDIQVNSPAQFTRNGLQVATLVDIPAPIAGPAGPAGPQGATGAPGATGAQGPPGSLLSSISCFDNNPDILIPLVTGSDAVVTFNEVTVDGGNGISLVAPGKIQLSRKGTYILTLTFTLSGPGGVTFQQLGLSDASTNQASWSATSTTFSGAIHVEGQVVFTYGLTTNTNTVLNISARGDSFPPSTPGFGITQILARISYTQSS